MFIELTRNEYSEISAEDAEWVVAFKWCAKPERNTTYAMRRDYTSRKTGRTVYLHREILSRMLGRKILSHEITDHLDGNGLNNRRENLRLATPSLNRRNHHRFRSPEHGVYYERSFGRWRVRIDRKSYGCFATKEEAIARAQEVRR